MLAIDPRAWHRDQHLGALAARSGCTGQAGFRWLRNVNQRAKLSRLGVETASNSSHLGVSSPGVLAGGIWSVVHGYNLSKSAGAIRFIIKVVPGKVARPKSFGR